MLFSKSLTKVISNLKQILPHLMSKEQPRYDEGHRILYDIILAHETIHNLKTSKKVGMFA